MSGTIPKLDQPISAAGIVMLPEPEAAAALSPTARRGIEPHIYRTDEIFADASGDGDQHLGLGDHWSVPWADLMMVMFVLFAALIAAQALQPRVEAVVESKPEPVPQRFDVEREKKIAEQVLSRQPSFQPFMELNVFAQSQQAVRDADIHDVEVALLADQSVKVSVQGPMLFELGKANLKPGMKSFLNRLAVIIAATPYQVRVVGHTDDQPINTGRFPSNWELSLVRGSRVARYLIEAAGLDPTRFVIMGRGQYAPAVPNEDASNRALNRRVEIIITRDIEPSRQEVSS